MKRLTVVLFTFLTFVVLFAGKTQAVFAAEQDQSVIPAATGRITVRVNSLRSDAGDLSVALFNGAKGFPGKFERAVMKALVPASDAGHVVVFDNVPFGTYAVAVRHDENANGKLDSNFLGMPKEGVGTSNNPRTRFGPPSFEDASFGFDQSGLELVINLRYL
ncbi:MAG: DUF2141 domain-containing protein [Chlorobiaceae bacterium]|jgi:uncharacterized protein (DUF2141 family)|nr:DUF2141 domain-containing protein [Chlorobiaceae bacterium]